MKTNKRHRIGAENPGFRGGKSTSKDGYVVLTSKIWGDDRGRREHQVVMERMLARPLAPGEVVHHKNGIRADNRPENLELMPNRAAHNREHGTGRLLVCLRCGAEKWYSRSILARFKGDLTQYRCRPCALRSTYRKPCVSCGVEFEGRMNAFLCTDCGASRTRARLAKFLSERKA